MSYCLPRILLGLLLKLSLMDIQRGVEINNFPKIKIFICWVANYSLINKFWQTFATLIRFMALSAIKFEKHLEHYQNTKILYFHFFEPSEKFTFSPFSYFVFHSPHFSLFVLPFWHSSYIKHFPPSTYREYILLNLNSESSLI